MIEAIAVLLVPLVIGTLLLHRARGRRFQGRAYDPNRPVIQRAGAVRVGMTGRMCPYCGVATFGWSDRCGKCHRVPTSDPSLVAAEPMGTGEVPSVRRFDP